MYAHTQHTRTSAHAEGDDTNAHAHSNVPMSKKASMGSDHPVSVEALLGPRFVPDSSICAPTDGGVREALGAA